MALNEAPNALRCSKELTYTKYMVFCCLNFSMGCFCSGWITGSANIPGKITHACDNGDSHVTSNAFPDCLPMNDALWGFAVASYCIGALLGAASGGYVRTRFGSIKTTTVNSLGYIFGGILTGCATNPAMFIIGRIIAGYACGITSIDSCIYVSEIAPPPVRGALSIVYQLLTVFSMLLASVIGLPLSVVPLWRVNYALVAVPALLTLICTPFCVESPRYLVSINKMEQAKINLERLRPNSDIRLELYEIIEGQLGSTDATNIVSALLPVDQTTLYTPTSYFEIKSEPNESKSTKDSSFVPFTPPLATPPPQYKADTVRASMNVIQTFRDPFIRHITFVVIGIHMFQQLAGLNAVTYYSTTMFNQLFDSNMSKYLAITGTCVNFFFTCFAVLLVERMGRRVLMLTSLSGITLFSLLLCFGYVFNIRALMILSIYCYIMMYAFGMGSIPWMISSEVSPVYASSSITAIGATVNWSMNFLIGQCFPIIFNKIHGYSFLIFAGFGLSAIFFVYFKIPETKGRSIEDIVKDFKASTLKD